LFGTLGGLAVIATLIAVGKANQPFDAEIRLNEASVKNPQLPPMRNAIITLNLDNETKTDTIPSMDATAVFTNIPHRFLDKPVHITVTCQNFQNVDTTLVLNRQTELYLYRDPITYGDIHFRLWNIVTEEPVALAIIEIEGQQAQADENGFVTLSIPLERQRIAYKIKTGLPLINDSIFMPSGKDDVILVEQGTFLTSLP
jgi:hypothetical protein